MSSASIFLVFSSHKFNGPKGIGALYVRSRGKRVRLEPQVVGGGQQRGIRSGTLNVPCIVGMAEAIVLSVNAMEKETPRIASIRNVLFEKLFQWQSRDPTQWPFTGRRTQVAKQLEY